MLKKKGRNSFRKKRLFNLSNPCYIIWYVALKKSTSNIKAKSYQRQRRVVLYFIDVLNKPYQDFCFLKILVLCHSTYTVVMGL